MIIRVPLLLVPFSGLQACLWMDRRVCFSTGFEDISACAALAHKGLEGVITGRALYDGRIDLKQALAAAKGELC